MDIIDKPISSPLPENNLDSPKKTNLIPVLLVLFLLLAGVGIYYFLNTKSEIFYGTFPISTKEEVVLPSPITNESQEVAPSLEKGTYLNKDLGIFLKHPENWKLVKEDKDITIWNIMSDSKVIGTVILRKNQVLGETTYFASEQQIKSAIDEISGNKKISISGKSASETFTFSKDIGGKPDEVIIELSIPDQDVIGSKKSAELYSEFDEVLRTISIPSENKIPDPSKSKISLSKEKVKSDGNDSSIITATIRDNEGNIIPDIYLEIIPEDQTDFGYNQIISKSSLPTQRTNSAAAIIKDKIFVAAGRNYNDILSIVEVYNPLSNTWSATNSINSQREELSLDEVNGNLYAIGGNKGIFAQGGIDGSFWNKVEMYDSSPNISAWLNKKPLPEGLKDHASAVVDGKIYTFAGMSRNIKTECGDNEGYVTQVYDPIADSWSIANEKVLCGTGMISAVVDKKVYLFGGHHDAPFQKDQSIPAILYDLNIYDTTTNSWSKGPKLPHPRERGGLGIINGKIFLIGGFKSFGGKAGEDYNQYVDVFDPETNAWTTMGEFYPTPIDFSYVTYNSKIYTFGGEHFYSWPYRNSVFEFSPLKTSREVIINPSNENGSVQFKLRSLFPGSRSYKIVAYDSQGKQIEIGKTSIFFE